MIIIREEKQNINEAAYKVISASDLYNALQGLDASNLAVFKFYVYSQAGIGNHLVYGAFRYIPYKTDHAFTFRDGKNAIELAAGGMKEIRIFKDSIGFAMKNGGNFSLGFDPQLYKYL